MNDPSISIGFIIFNPLWRQEVQWENGHWRTANKWINDNNMRATFDAIKGKHNINDEEDFLVEYIGAVKLSAQRGTFYCRVPRKPSPEKSSLKRYFRSKGYIMTGCCSDADEEKAITRLFFPYPYNQTVIHKKDEFGERFFYNPFRIGD